jgi:hypothetical protein
MEPLCDHPGIPDRSTALCIYSREQGSGRYDEPSPRACLHPVYSNYCLGLLEESGAFSRCRARASLLDLQTRADEERRRRERERVEESAVLRLIHSRQERSVFVRCTIACEGVIGRGGKARGGRGGRAGLSRQQNREGQR